MADRIVLCAPANVVAPGWTVEVFGGVAAICQERVIRRFRTQKTASLLAYLACHKTQRHGREKLADLLWPEFDPRDSRMSLNVAVCSLRQALELPDAKQGVILSDREFVQLNPELVITDVAAFESARLLARREQDPNRRLAALEAAIQLYRAEPMAGLYDTWVLAEQRHLAQEHYQLLLEVIDHHLARGAYREALDYGWQALQADSLAEEGHLRVMQSYAGMQQPTAAIRRFHEYEETLRRATGGSPSAALERLAGEIKRQPLKLAPMPNAQTNGHMVSDSGPAKPAWVTVLYRRDSPEDSETAERLTASLLESKQPLFVDRDRDWSPQRVRLIESRIRTSECVLVLLSPSGLESEMLSYEVGLALEAMQQSGRPKVIGIWLGSEEAPALPPPFSWLPLHPCDPKSPSVGATALEAFHGGRGMEQRLAGFDSLGGLVPMTSTFYIVREADDAVRSAIALREGLVLIKGPRQTGKSSLLARAAQQARDAGYRVAVTDLSAFPAQDLESTGSLYLALAESLMGQVDMSLPLEEVWDSRRTPNWNLERFLKTQVLSTATTPFVWLLDEVDRLFGCPFGTDVFSLFRSWYNTRAALPHSPWPLLSLVMAYATETRLFIANPALSPFNIGEQVRLEEFSAAEASELNRRYGSPLTDAEVLRVHALVGGHPHLVRTGLQEIVTRALTLSEFEAAADSDGGPYGDHLRRMYSALSRDPGMAREVQQVLNGGSCSTSDAFYRLRTAGVLSGSDSRKCGIRCPLYASYLRRWPW